MNDGYFHTFPSPYHLKRLGRDNEEESTIVGYGVNQYHEKCLIGLVGSNGVMKYVNLSRRSHSLFQLYIITRTSKKPLRIPWKSFQLYGQNHVLIILNDSNQVLETKIPSTQEVDISNVTVVAEHKTFIEYLHCNPLNSKTFITGTKGGEIKLWHVVHPRHKDGIPSTTLLWTIQAFENSLNACTLFYHRTNEVFHFLLFASDEKNHLKLFNLRTRKVEKESYVESQPLVIMKHIGGEENQSQSYLATVNTVGTLHLWSIDLKLKQTLYLERSYNVNCITCFYSPSTKSQVLVVCLSKKSEEELENIDEEVINYLGEEEKEHLVRFYDLSTDGLLKEFVMPSSVMFCSLVTTFQRGRNFLVIGNNKGVLNAWAIADLHLNQNGEEADEGELGEVEEEGEGSGVEDREEKGNRPRLEITVDDDDDDEIPQPEKTVPVPTPKELSVQRILDLEEMKDEEGGYYGNEDDDDDDEPRTTTPVPFEIKNRSTHSINSNETPIVTKHERGDPISSTTKKKKKRNEAQYRPKVKKPEKPTEPKKTKSMKTRVKGNANFGKPEKFTQIMEEETIRRTTLKNNDEPTHRFSRLRVMDQEEMERRIKEIENLELDEEVVLKEEMARRERTLEMRDGQTEPTFVPPTEVKYGNLLSLNVDPKKYEKSRKKVKKQLHPNFLEVRKERKPRLFNEFFHPNMYDQEMAYVPKMEVELNLEPLNIPSILEMGHETDLFNADIL